MSPTFLSNQNFPAPQTFWESLKFFKFEKCDFLGRSCIYIRNGSVCKVIK